MRKMSTIAGLAALLSVAGGYALAQTPMKLTKAECQSIWSKADAGGAGSLTNTQAQAYVTDFKSVDANADGKLSSAEFLAGCQKGLAHDSATSGASSGTSGESPIPPAKQY